MPLTNCLRFRVSTCEILAKCSGANVGIGGYWTRFLPAHTVSPMLKMPGSKRPTMSPAYASSTMARSSAIIEVPTASLRLRSPCMW